MSLTFHRQRLDVITLHNEHSDNVIQIQNLTQNVRKSHWIYRIMRLKLLIIYSLPHLSVRTFFILLITFATTQVQRLPLMWRLMCLPRSCLTFRSCPHMWNVVMWTDGKQAEKSQLMKSLTRISPTTQKWLKRQKHSIEWMVLISMSQLHHSEKLRVIVRLLVGAVKSVVVKLTVSHRITVFDLLKDMKHLVTMDYI